LILLLGPDAGRIVVIILNGSAAGNDDRTVAGLCECRTGIIVNSCVVSLVTPAVVRERTPRTMMRREQDIIGEPIRMFFVTLPETSQNGAPGVPAGKETAHVALAARRERKIDDRAGAVFGQNFFFVLVIALGQGRQEARRHGLVRLAAHF